MNLNEAIKTLKTAGYLIERLTAKYVDLENLLQHIVYDYGINPKYMDAFIDPNGGGEDYSIYIKQETVSNDPSEGPIINGALYNITCPSINITDKEFESILNKNSYHLRHRGWVNPKTGICTYEIEKINTDIIYHDENDLFCHLSEAGPEKILKSGLRCRAGNDKNTQWQKSVDWYGKRIYLTKLTPKYENRLKRMEAEAFAILNSDDSTDTENLVNLHKYTIRLPKTFPLHKDPEYANGRYYTMQNIPPQFIEYDRQVLMEK